MNKNFWKNKRVLITGHTGFKGGWLTLILSNLKSRIVGYALDPISKPNLFDDLKLTKFLQADFREDILNIKKLDSVIKKFKPQIIFHLAAQSSVLVSYENPVSTIKTNVIGTTNVLEVLKKCKSVKSAIIVTTDKVYLNLEQRKKFKELDHLGGYDVYSGSKASCEVLTQSYLKSFFQKSKCNMATVRSGNCIGGGDWTKDRIVKDCAESFVFNKTLTIRSPKATRPWQHVIEPVFGYIRLAEKLYFQKKYSGAWNFGPNLKNNLNVKKVADFGKKILKSKSEIKIQKQKYYESKNLSLDSSKALKYLNWKTHLNSKEALKLAFEWYKFYYQNKNIKKVLKLTFDQIKNYKNRFYSKFYGKN